MVYVNSMFCATRVDEPGKEESVKSLWLDVKVGGKYKIRIGAFYRAGNLQKDSQTEVDHKICEEICMNFRPKRIIMGDFNLRGYEKFVEDTKECKLFRHILEEELFLHQFVTGPTRQNSILDLVFSDDRNLIRNVNICEGLGNSDHNMIKFNLASDSNLLLAKTAIFSNLLLAKTIFF